MSNVSTPSEILPAFVYDRDYHDTVNVLELLNVELLEARYNQLLTDRVRTAQSQTLELVIIALILAEILMAVFSG
jgi:uncharacterized Rmd1/YagE family protein